MKKNKYEMRPTGITLSGREGNRNEVKLYLEKGNGTSELENNPDFDYKIVWSTAGKFGKLSSPLVVNGKVLTIFNKNSASYECLDKDTKAGVETINARIYSKKKAETEYKLYDDVTGTIKINSDSKKLIFHVGLTVVQSDTVSGPYFASNFSKYYEYLCQEAVVAFVPVVKDAASYSIHFYGFKNGGGYSTTNQSWTPTNLSYYGPASWVTAKYNGSVFCVLYTSGGSASPFPGCNYSSSAGPTNGMAEVIVTLK